MSSYSVLVRIVEHLESGLTLERDIVLEQSGKTSHDAINALCSFFGEQKKGNCAVIMKEDSWYISAIYRVLNVHEPVFKDDTKPTLTVDVSKISFSTVNFKAVPFNSMLTSV